MGSKPYESVTDAYITRLVKTHCSWCNRERFPVEMSNIFSYKHIWTYSCLYIQLSRKIAHYEHKKKHTHKR